MDRIDGWSKFSVINTPEGLHACTNSNFSVPYNFAGYQQAESGAGYLGLIPFSLDLRGNTHIFRFFAWGSPDPLYEYRESIIGSFTAPLENRYYQFECYLANSRLVGDQFNLGLATHAFDFMLLDSIYHPQVSTPTFIDASKLLNLNPSGAIIIDTLNWTKLQVCLEAKGGEQYFAIGTMRDSTLLNDFILYGSASGVNQRYTPYYYFDSFSLYACDTCCGRKPEEEVVISGNGTLSSPTFKMTLQNGSEADLTLFDCLGKLILYHRFTYGEPPFELPEVIARGMYHYEITTTAGFSQSGKVMKM